MVIAAWVALVIIASLIVFQISLACGAPLGRFAWGGKYRVLPKKLRLSSSVAVVIFGIFAMFILSKTGWIAGIHNPVVIQFGLWVIFAYLVLMIFANSVSRSKHERYTMTPITLILAACFLALALW